jgi:DNA-binding transcriptional LysR family regulator
LGRLTLTDAGRRLQPEAEAVISAAERARVSVEDVKALTTGTVTFGASSSAHYYLLSNLVIQFRRRYPGVKVRAFAHNSTEVARAVRDGEFESGLVALPIDDRGLELSQTVWECEAGYFSTDSALLQRIGKNLVFARCESRFATSVFSPLGVVSLDLTP